MGADLPVRYCLDIRPARWLRLMLSETSLTAREGEAERSGLARAERRRAARRRRSRRRRAAAGLGVLATAGALAAALAASSAGGGRRGAVAGAGRRPRPAPARAPARPSSFAVGLETVRLVEPGRTVRLPDGSSEPRTLLTYVRYPALGSPRATDVRGAAPARAYGPFPLVVFSHGFAEMPALYAKLLQAWAHAGFVVAAPVFPLEAADAPGGPDESDLINEPRDIRFTISRLLAASASGAGVLSGLLAPSEVAVAGQSDGGDATLAVAYNSQDRDPRVKAAVVLSGAELPGLGGFDFPPGSPPLLATQGTADTINLPGETETYFAAARAPKYLLELLGAGHLPPYATQQPQLSIVERVSTDFLRAYLEGRRPALRRLPGDGHVPGVATLLAVPRR
jgi:fermentation-respiration switch protein FrsA (DUF1100 family)